MDEIYFSQIREDSQVELRLQRLFTPRRIVCIGSGGCTAFSLLHDTVQTVYAVDINPAQCALIELKRAAVLSMNLELYLSFIGESPSTERVERYLSLREQLSPYARKFWDRHTIKIAQGINRVGVTERFYQFVGANVRANVLGEEPIRELFSCRSIKEQQKVYERYFNNELVRGILKVLLSKTSQLEFYPSYWFTDVDEGAFSSFFIDQLEREVLSKDVSNNYFLSQLLLGCYLSNVSEGRPHYLTPEGFESTQQNIAKLVVVNDSLQRFLSRQSGIDAFFLSNVFDWGKEIDRERICAAVLSAKSQEARLLYRNMYAPSELPPTFTSQFIHDESLSKELLALERSMLYRKVTSGTLH